MSEKPMSEWISVEDRLPEISMDPEAPASKQMAYVIAADDRGQVRGMVYRWERFAKSSKGRMPRWEENNGQLAWFTVTHWMPMPEHPSKIKSET